MALDLADNHSHRVDPDPKAVVRRLIKQVINDGRHDLIDELYAPAMVRGARRSITPFRESSPTCTWRSWS